MNDALDRERNRRQEEVDELSDRLRDNHIQIVSVTPQCHRHPCPTCGAPSKVWGASTIHFCTICHQEWDAPHPIDKEGT